MLSDISRRLRAILARLNADVSTRASATEAAQISGPFLNEIGFPYEATYLPIVGFKSGVPINTFRSLMEGFIYVPASGQIAIAGRSRITNDNSNARTFKVGVKLGGTYIVVSTQAVSAFSKASEKLWVARYSGFTPGWHKVEIGLEIDGSISSSGVAGFSKLNAIAVYSQDSNLNTGGFEWS